MTTVPTVSPTELIRSSWGNTVATELNTKTVKTDGSMPMTGPLIITAAPGLRLRRTGDQPYLQFENTTGATSFGTVQATSGGLLYHAPAAAATHRFLVNSIERFRVNSTGVDVTGTLTADAFTTTGVGRFGGNGGQIQLIDTSTSGSDFHDVFMAFYGAGVSMVSPGSRTGFVGFAGSSTLQLHNEVAGGNISLVTGTGGIVSTTTGGPITFNAGGSGDIALTAGGEIMFTQGGAERGRVDGSLMWGKTTGGSANVGVELFESGTIYSTTATNAVANLLIRHKTDADNAPYVQFANAAGGVISQILQDNTAPVGVLFPNCHATDPSDARLKLDRGPIVEATSRLRRLRPHRFTWKAHPAVERDGFFADEVAAVIPEAVFGAADAVDGNGGVVAQQLDRSALIPLLTAALLEVDARLAELEAV